MVYTYIYSAGTLGNTLYDIYPAAQAKVMENHVKWQIFSSHPAMGVVAHVENMAFLCGV